MGLYVFHDGRYCIDENKDIWTQCNADYDFWGRYLVAFDEVIIVARAQKVNSSDLLESHRKVNYKGQVKIYPLPYFIGAWQYARSYKALYKKISCLLDKVSENDAFLIRTPLSFFLPQKFYRVDYGAEVVGDAFDSLYKKTLISFIYAKLYEKYERKVVNNAQSVSYVTKYALQKKFPPPAGAYSTNYSSVSLSENDYFFVSFEDLFDRFSACKRNNKWHIVAVGSLEFEYKGAGFLIEAVSKLLSRGYRISVTWLGGGKLLDQYKLLVEQKGLSHIIEFVGRVSPDVVKSYYKESDLFVLSSKTEGLPRAMIEAMASSMVCVGTDVGGVSELISSDFMAAPNSVDSLGAAIEKAINMDADQLVSSAQKNYELAKGYHQEILNSKRLKFYKTLVWEK